MRRRYSDPQVRASGLQGKRFDGGVLRRADGHTERKLGKRKAQHADVFFQLLKIFLNDGAGLSHIVLTG